MKKIIGIATKTEFSRFFIWFVLSLFVLLRIPSLVEPLWYADEGIYTVVAQALHHGRMLYSGIWDNKPPFLYLLYFFSGGLFGIKLLSIFFGIGEVFLLYKIAQRIFLNEKSVFFATLLFSILLGTPFLEGNIANAENFMLFPIFAAFYLVLKYEALPPKVAVYSAILFFCALMIKIVAIFDLMALIAFVLIRAVQTRRNLLSLKKGALFFFATLLSLSFATLVIFWIQGNAGEFINAVFFKSFQYVSEKNTAGISNSVLVFKTILLFGGIASICVYRKKLPLPAIFIALWILISLYNVFFSQRLFTHYLLLLIPSLSLLFGFIFELHKKKKALLSGVFVMLCIGILMIFPYYDRVIGYYMNYASFISFRKDVTSYRAFFDSTTPRNYELARIVNDEMKNKKVLVWSDGGQVYALLNMEPVGKYIVAYHMIFYQNALNETKELFKKEKPDIIIEITAIPRELELLEDYQESFRVSDARVYERQL